VVHVFDTRSKQLISSIDGVPGVHGVIVVPELRRVYASTTDGSRLPSSTRTVWPS
jgi:hypothetical protein